MGFLRSVERSIIKHECYVRDGTTNGWKMEWKKYQARKTANKAARKRKRLFA